MRNVAWTFFLCSAFALQLGCGDNGGDDSTTTTNPTNTPSLPLTSETMTNDTGTQSSSGEPTGGTATDTSASAPTGTETDPVLTTDINTATTNNDTSTSTNPATTNETSLSSSSESGGTPCEEIQATLQPVPPNIMLVLDKSGSMVSDPSGYWDHDNDPGTPTITRWKSLYNVVSDIVMNNETKMNLGAVLFPSKSAVSMYNAGACPVNANPEVPVQPMNAADILAAIPGANDTMLKGGTPSAAGMTTALNHLKMLDPMVPRAVLLITDGAANCRSDAATEQQRFETYDQSLHTIVGDAFTVDMIPTYVIGIAISNAVTAGNADGTPANAQDGNPNAINPYEKLNELAMLGGKPKNDPNEKFYQTVNQLELQAALDAIIGDALSCKIPLESEPAFPDDTEVLVGGTKVPHVMDCASENGWVFTNPMGPYNEIELCGTACLDLKAAGEADVNFYCSAG
ncbi:MAG: VWA domain-containing protein [Myxococcales bacterium]|nr:VWA domain-containing protein [Myxococcales bacterium]